jgi:hypothetical protein
MAIAAPKAAHDLARAGIAGTVLPHVGVLLELGHEHV